MVLFVVNGNDIYTLVGWEVFEAYMVHICWVEPRRPLRFSLTLRHTHDMKTPLANSSDNSFFFFFFSLQKLLEF